jgi:uncharacterized protein YeaO (DUF488 family)
MLRVKRVYDTLDESDGRRILVDRLWPRGLSREKAAVDVWLKEVSPSNELRKWFGHDAGKWDEFRRRYFAELDANEAAVAELRKEVGKGSATLLFGTKETEHNNAVALREYLRGGRRSSVVSPHSTDDR